MSPVMMFFRPAASAMAAAARTPAAGPLITVCTAWLATSEDASIPPFACMMRSSLPNPRSASCAATDLM